jgi:hypothetical protein
LNDRIHIAATIATLLGVVAAVIALWLSYWTFQRQTVIQARQAAHNATQEHMQLRVEHSEIRLIEEQLGNSPVRSPDRLVKLKEDKPKQFRLYVTIAEHGIAMAEYIYLLADGDKGWKQTAQSWIVTYEPYLLGDELYDCRDWDQGFIQFVDEALGPGFSREDFCRYGAQG